MNKYSALLVSKYDIVNIDSDLSLVYNARVTLLKATIEDLMDSIRYKKRAIDDVDYYNFLVKDDKEKLKKYKMYLENYLSISKMLLMNNRKFEVNKLDVHDYESMSYYVPIGLNHIDRAREEDSDDGFDNTAYMTDYEPDDIEEDSDYEFDHTIYGIDYQDYRA